MNKTTHQHGLRQRSFEIIRLPDLEDSSFLFNNVRVAYVASCPETDISFYVNNGQGGVIGVRVYPDERKVLKNATSKNNGNKYCHSKDDYLQFKHVFGNDKHILASHAVYIAWRNKEIPAGMTIDHIDGCTTNNDVRNLRCVSNENNNRDGGFLRKLRNKEKALKAKIEATEIMAIIEAQNLTEGGKFSYKGHEFVLDHVDHFRVKCLD